MNKRALYKISYGMYIVSSKNGDKINAQIANTLFQITSEPPTIAVSINKENLTHEFITKSKVFGVSVLSVDTPINVIGNFGFKSGRDIDKFADVKYELKTLGVPILSEYTIAYFELEVINVVDVGTHTIFIGKAVNADVVSDAEPMTYAYYHAVKGGKSPKTAPTYIDVKEEKKEEGGKKMKKYRCTVCGYIYDPEKGDPDSGIEPGTPFEDIPDDWSCPICGVSKEDFEVIE